MRRPLQIVLGCLALVVMILCPAVQAWAAAWNWDAEVLAVGTYGEVSADYVYDGDQGVLWATWNDDGTIRVMNTVTGESREVFSTEARLGEPRISRNHVVWASGSRFNPWDIYVYDITTQQTVKLPHQGHTPDVSYGRVVWAGEAGLYLYDIGTGQTTLIWEGSASSPDIDGQSIAWEGRGVQEDLRTQEIYFHSLWNGETTRLTTNVIYDRMPRTSGSHVVWEGGDDNLPDDTEIYLWCGNSLRVTQVTDDAVYDMVPQLLGVGEVVWTKLGGTSGGDVFLYDHATGVTSRLNRQDAAATEVSTSGYSSATWIESGRLFLYDPSLGGAVRTWAPGGDASVQLARSAGGTVFLTQWNPDVSRYDLVMLNLAWGLSDIEEGSWEADVVKPLAFRDIIGGYADGTFRAEEPVSRQQFCKMMAKAARIPVTVQTACPFADVERSADVTDPLYPYRYVGAAFDAGFITGFDDGSFRPYSDITRAQLVTTVVRAAQELSPNPLQVPLEGFEGVWGDFDQDHGAYARIADYNRLIPASAAADPWRPATRLETAEILCRYLELLDRGPSPTPGPDGITPAKVAELFVAEVGAARVVPGSVVVWGCRSSADRAVAMVSVEMVQGRDAVTVLFRRDDGDWTIVAYGSAVEDPEDLREWGFPADLIEYLCWG